jgi:hypothetical protein
MLLDNTTPTGQISLESALSSALYPALSTAGYKLKGSTICEGVLVKNVY